MRSAMTCYSLPRVLSNLKPSLLEQSCDILGHIIFRIQVTQYCTMYSCILVAQNSSCCTKLSRVEHQLNHMLHTTNANPFVDFRPTTS
jgi:hypothetical protein